MPTKKLTENKNLCICKEHWRATKDDDGDGDDDDDGLNAYMK